MNSEAVDVAREYYNSEDADAFYSTVWGGEDIHIGLYHSENVPIAKASLQTKKRMLEKLKGIDADSRVIDLGSGYGGSARYIAKEYGCEVVALNLSEVENERARKLNREQGLEKKIEVVDGNFEELPYDDESFDIVWSIDSFLHSPARDRVIREASRVLKSGGECIFTDPMKADDCPDGVLQPILDRIHLDSMASPQFYRSVASENGLEEVGFEELTIHLERHYASVLKETKKRDEELREKISDEYRQNMQKGLRHWVEGARNNYLCWGILHFKKG